MGSRDCIYDRQLQLARWQPRSDRRTGSILPIQGSSRATLEMSRDSTIVTPGGDSTAIVSLRSWSWCVTASRSLA